MRHLTWSLLLFLATITFISSTGWADEIDRFIEQQMAQRQIPGLAFAVVKDGKVAETRAYGLANLETSSPVTTESVFEIASMTKPITATAIIKLVNEGTISLDDSITKFVPEAPPEWTAITVGHLLNHTGGFAEQIVVSANGVALMDVSTKAQLDEIVATPLMFPAGSNASYSDPGYFLLGVILESATQMSYSEVMKKLIFDACAMDNSLILDQWRIVENRVGGYTLRGPNLLNSRRDWQHELPSFFGVMSTIEDLAKFEIAYNDGRLTGDHLSSQMQTPSTLTDGSLAIVFGKQYGLGWQITDYRGHRVSEHGGFSGTHLLRFPDENIAVLVLTNLDLRSGSRPDLLARGIVGLFDERFLRPDMMPISSESNEPSIDRLQSVLAQAGGWATSELVSEDFRKRWAGLPGRVQEGRAVTLTGITNIQYIGSDIPDGKDIHRFGTAVGDISYYRGTSNEKTICLSVWKDDNGQIIDIDYYRP